MNKEKKVALLKGHAPIFCARTLYFPCDNGYYAYLEEADEASEDLVGIWHFITVDQLLRKLGGDDWFANVIQMFVLYHKRKHGWDYMPNAALEPLHSDFVASDDYVDGGSHLPDLDL